MWVEYPDIESVCRKIGAAPTYSPAAPYTFPVIHDPAHNAVISESIEIARYLDKTYPGTTPLLDGSQALQEAFQTAIMKTAMEPSFLIMLPLSCAKLNPVSEAYFRNDRERKFGMKLEEFSPVGATRDGHWKNLRDQYGIISSWLDKNENGAFVMGEHISYADVTIAAPLIWMRTTFGVDSAEWKDILTWQNGRWVGFMKEISKYEQVTE